MIKGKVQLDFCDPLTGKVKERVGGENYFTDALNSLYNKAPMGCDRRTLDSTIIGTVEPELNLATTALGGVLLFPDTVATKMVDGVDYQLYEPMSHQPTAYSSYGTQDTADSKSGSYNIYESGDITNGYRFVHEWGSAYGNGVIKTICLTHKYGGTAYGQKNYFDNMGLLTMSNNIGVNCRYLGICDDYVYYCTPHYNYRSGEVRRIRRPLYEMYLNQQAFHNDNSELVYPFADNHNQGIRVCLSEADKKVYFISGDDWDSDTSTYDPNKLKITTVDISGTPTPESPEVINASSTIYAVCPSRYGTQAVKRGGYLYYVLSYDATTTTLRLCKINLSNTVDMEYIYVTDDNPYGELQLLPDTNDITYGNRFLIDTNDAVHKFTDNTDLRGRLVVGRKCGVWQPIQRLSVDSNRQDPLTWQINPYYMATKFVLNTAVEKLSTLTAKLTYEVTHV